MKTYQIKIGTSKVLFKMVEDLMFANGYHWASGEKTSKADVAMLSYPSGISIFADQYARLSYGSMGYQNLERYEKQLDARIEMEALIIAIEPPTIKMRIADYDVILLADGSIKFGCSTISSKQVDEIFDARNKLRK